MFQEVKTLQFKCDLCGETAIVTNVIGYAQPYGWGHKHPANVHSMFHVSKDVCAKCLKIELEK